MKTTLTRQKLRQSAARRYKYVTLSNGDVARLQSITEPEIGAYEAIAHDEKGQWQLSRFKMRRRKLIQLCLVDDAGERLYAAEEVPGMLMDGGLAKELFDKCVEHTGLDNERESVDEAKKNSGQTDDSAPSSESVSSSESTTPSPGTNPSTPTSSPSGSPTGSSSPSATSGDAPVPSPPN